LEPLDVPPNNYFHPRLSPDGSRLVVQIIANKSRNIWVYDLSGDTQIRQLTFGGGNTLAIWTPDGQRVTFTSDRDGKQEVYWQPADGSGVAERLATAEEGALLAGSWSPDGKTLALMNGGSKPGGLGIWTLSHDGETTTLEAFADELGFQMGATFSPDGRWLAYASNENESNTSQVYVQPFPKTGAKHRVTQQGGSYPLWSRDGEELFYFNRGQLMGIDIATEPAFSFGNEQALGMRGFLAPPSSAVRPYDITPDGQRFLMIFPADQADSVAEAERINIVLNWFEELKERVPVP
jgi:Tol biopolymer transport system component